MTAATAAAPTTVLIVEDDPNIVDLMRANLLVRGFAVIVSVDGAHAVEMLEAGTVDIVLLDLMLPAVDGFDLCKLMREISSVGIIVVSARGGERDKVTALNAGADDYLTKPFGIEELLARMTATLRRTRPAGETAPAGPIELAPGIQLDIAARQVTRDGHAVHLTPTEYALLRELALNRGRLLSHTTLLQRVWGPAYATETEYVRVYVRRLRSKLEPDGSEPLIVTEPRAGYRLVGPTAAPGGNAAPTG